MSGIRIYRGGLDVGSSTEENLLPASLPVDPNQFMPSSLSIAHPVVLLKPKAAKAKPLTILQHLSGSPTKTSKISGLSKSMALVATEEKKSEERTAKPVVHFAETPTQPTPSPKPEEVESDSFKPSYQTFTPSAQHVNRAKFVKLDERVEVLAKANQSVGTMQRLNSEDVLRRVSVVINQHLTKCYSAFHKLPSTSTTVASYAPTVSNSELSSLRNANNQHTATEQSIEMSSVFDESRFLVPQFVYHFVRSPSIMVNRYGGICYSLSQNDLSSEDVVPDVDVIFVFAHTLFVGTHLSAECSIVCLIYLERLMELAHVPLLPRTWRPVLLGCLLLASKVWQDLNSWNIEFARIYPNLFALESVSNIERLILHHLKWDLFISSSMYGKYFFAIRSLTDKTNFRKSYFNMLGSKEPSQVAVRVEEATERVKQDLLSSVLSKSL